MTWVQTESASFTARHDDGDAPDAERVLRSLERVRDELRPLFGLQPESITVVLHGSVRAWR